MNNALHLAAHYLALTVYTVIFYTVKNIPQWVEITILIGMALSTAGCIIAAINTFDTTQDK